MGVLILRGGLVVDGRVGSVPTQADVVVVDGRIASGDCVARAELSARADVLDCSGHVIAPGFIDVHTHSDLTRFVYPGAQSRVGQGITTEIVGNCGMSPAPVGAAGSAALRETIGPVDVRPDVEFTWSLFDEYLDRVECAPSAVNTLALVGHGSIRHAVMGDSTDVATRGEREAIAALVGEALSAGAWGVSFGLMYAPGEIADVDELKATAAVAGGRDALVAAHLRAYDGPRLLDAVDEFLGFVDGGRIQISHLRAIGPNGRGVPEQVLQGLHRRRSAGVDVAADAYPYTAGHTTALQLLPPELRSAGVAAVLGAIRRDRTAVAEGLRGNEIGPEAITIVRTGNTPTEACGQTLSALAEGGPDWPYVLIELFERHDAAVDVIVEGSYPEDVEVTLRDPLVSIGSDGATLDCTHTANMPHPRSFGTFPRALRLLLDAGMPLGDTIAKATSLPAARVGLTDRGMIVPGAVADLVVLAPEQLADRATYAQPMQAPDGIRDVFVAGEAVLRDGVATDARPGRLLRSAA